MRALALAGSVLAREAEAAPAQSGSVDGSQGRRWREAEEAAAMEVKRLKVTELRSELQRRGLDSRGLKVDLAQRLQEALDAEMLEDEAGGGGAGPGGACKAEPRPVAASGGGPGGDEEEDEEEEEEDEEALLEDEDEEPPPAQASGQAAQPPPEPPEAAAVEAEAEPDASEKAAEEATAESGGVNGGEEQGTGKGEEDEPEERSGDETPGSEAPGDKAAEEQGEELAAEPGSNLPGAPLTQQRALHRGVRIPIAVCRDSPGEVVFVLSPPFRRVCLPLVAPLFAGGRFLPNLIAYLVVVNGNKAVSHANCLRATCWSSLPRCWLSFPKPRMR